jgi:hypothetical protein
MATGNLYLWRDTTKYSIEITAHTGDCAKFNEKIPFLVLFLKC